MQLRTRLTLQFLFAVSPILLTSFLVIYFSSTTFRKNEFYDRLEKKASTVCELLLNVDTVDKSMLIILENAQKDHLFREKISVYNAENEEIYTNNDTSQFKVNEILLNKVRQNNPLQYTEGDLEILAMPYNKGSQRLIVIAGAKDKYGLAKMNNLRNTLLFLFIVIIGITAIVGWVYATRALKPISTVISKAEKISASNLSERIDENRYNDEIGRLIKTFNKMLGRIEDAFNIQRVFMAGASHELKNPLTAITSQLEVIQLKERTNDEYKHIIASVFDDIKELNKMAVQLIDFGQLLYESKSLTYITIRIDELIGNFVDLFSKNNPNYTVVFKIDHLPDNEKKLIVKVNQALIYTALNNLAENACKFSTNNKVEILLFANNDKINLSFIDNGPGIADEDKKMIFEPFYRSKNAIATKGHGIGLALVAKIVSVHKATIAVANNPQGGTIFTIGFRR